MMLEVLGRIIGLRVVEQTADRVVFRVARRVPRVALARALARVATEFYVLHGRWPEITRGGRLVRVERG